MKHYSVAVIAGDGIQKREETAALACERSGKNGKRRKRRTGSDEYVPIDQLVETTQLFALSALTYLQKTN